MHSSTASHSQARPLTIGRTSLGLKRAAGRVAAYEQPCEVNAEQASESPVFAAFLESTLVTIDLGSTVEKGVRGEGADRAKDRRPGLLAYPFRSTVSPQEVAPRALTCPKAPSV